MIRDQYYNFVPHHVPAERNEIADCLSRLCGVISRTEHTPDDNIQQLPMSKKASVYKKELEIRDPLVERIAEIGGRDFDYIKMLQNVENKTEFKQAGAELCQAQHSLSLDLDTNSVGLITQPAVAGPRSLTERQLKIYRHKGMVWLMK